VDAGQESVRRAHAEAEANGQPGYADPATGLFVFTRAHLLARGRCCANGCRHCPYRRTGGHAVAQP
jgi:hypothetical protein